MQPSANISQITWIKVFLSTTLLYTLHLGSTKIYSNYCTSGWMGAALMTAPHCTMSFNIMTWSRQWYIAICWIMVAKIVQDVSCGVEWLIYKGDISSKKNPNKTAGHNAKFQPGRLFQTMEYVMQGDRDLYKKVSKNGSSSNPVDLTNGSTSGSSSNPVDLTGESSSNPVKIEH